MIADLRPLATQVSPVKGVLEQDFAWLETRNQFLTIRMLLADIHSAVLHDSVLSRTILPSLIERVWRMTSDEALRVELSCLKVKAVMKEPPSVLLRYYHRVHAAYRQAWHDARLQHRMQMR